MVCPGVGWMWCRLRSGCGRKRPGHLYGFQVGCNARVHAKRTYEICALTKRSVHFQILMLLIAIASQDSDHFRLRSRL